MTYTKTEQAEAIEKLHEWIKPGDTVWTQLKHVSKSGMMRVIQVVKIEDNSPLYLGWNVAKAVDSPYNAKHEGVRRDGCGMDMGFDLIYSLSYALFKGFDCIGKGCPSNDHVNHTDAPEGTCRDHVEQEEVCYNLRCKPWRHSDPGYALKQRWL